MNNYFFYESVIYQEVWLTNEASQGRGGYPSSVCLILHHEELKKAAPAVLGTLPGLNLVKT